MSNAKISRTVPLTEAEQKAFLSTHVPGRIAVIQAALKRANQIMLEHNELHYGSAALAALLTRAIAGFLGLGVRNGNLREDHSHFTQKDGKSWEVKLDDISGGSCLRIKPLSQPQRKIIEEGLNETNHAFAHLTFWSDPANQASGGLATPDYKQKQLERIRNFADTIIELYNKHTAGLPKPLSMKYWQFVTRKPDGSPDFDAATYLIQQLPKHGVRWSLWFSGQGQLSLHKPNAEEFLFDTPEDAVKHCREVDAADPLWIDFKKRISHDRKDNAFPPGLGDLNQWTKC